MLALVLALFIGITLGVLGAGGGILTVPLLHYIVGFDAKASTAASLLIVGITASVAAGISMKRGLVNVRAALSFAVPSALGMIVSRTLVLPQLPDQIIVNPGWAFSRDTLILVPFSLVMMAAAWRMFKGPANSRTNTAGERSSSEPQSNSHLRSTMTLIFSGLSIGLLSGFVGAGGGFLIVPALHLLLGLSLPSAIGTSLLVIALNSAIGVASDLALGQIYDWRILTGLLGACVLGMLVGLKASSRLPANTIRPAFALLMLIMSVIILLKELLP